LVQNALKLTYEHLQVQKFFLGSLSLAMKGIKRDGRGEEGREGEGRGGEKREGKGEREGEGREAPQLFTRGCAPVYLCINLIKCGI
jgi:hypothetical protein